MGAICNSPEWGTNAIHPKYIAQLKIHTMWATLTAGFKVIPLDLDRFLPDLILERPQSPHVLFGHPVLLSSPGYCALRATAEPSRLAGYVRICLQNINIFTE